MKQNGESSLNSMFFCEKCEKSFSILSDFFYNMKTSVRDNLLVMRFWLGFWVCDIRTVSAAMLLGVSEAVFIQTYRYFGDIISWKLLKEDDLFVFGN